MFVISFQNNLYKKNPKNPKKPKTDMYLFFNQPTLWGTSLHEGALHQFYVKISRSVCSWGARKNSCIMSFIALGYALWKTLAFRVYWRCRRVALIGFLQSSGFAVQLILKDNITAEVWPLKLLDAVYQILSPAYLLLLKYYLQNSENKRAYSAE